MERSSPGIFRAIQISVGNSPRPNDPSVYEKEIRGKLQKVCCQVEECGINGPTTPHQSRRKFHVRGHFTLPYYDMLVINAFIEFEDLMYFVGRIEDGIKKGKILDIETITFGKKRNVSNKHVEERSRGKFEAMGEYVGNLFHSRTPCTQVPPVRCFSP